MVCAILISKANFLNFLVDNKTLKQKLSTKRLDHLGLPAGLCKRYRIAERIDELIPLAKDDRTKSTHGQRLVAMILNSQGFCKSPLYMTETFYRDKPVDLLIGKGLKAKHFNDDALGRTLDALHQYGTTKLFCRIAFDLAKVLNLLGSNLNLDTTSLALYGQYDSDEWEGAPKPMYGHSKDHRPDLKQIVVSLISTGPAGIPVWFESHDGNNSDKTSFHETIKEFDSFTQSLRDSESFLWVADSALYTRDELQQSGIQWLTHPPATYKLVQQYIEQPYGDDEFDWETLTKDYQSTPVKGPEGEHWHLILSGQRRKAKLKTLERKIGKEYDAQSKTLNSLTKKRFGCEKDAQDAIKALAKKFKYHKLSGQTVTAKMGHKGKGRPAAGAQKVVLGYHLEGALVKDSKAIEQAKIPCGRFILATNRDGMSAQAILDTYKEQDKVERGFLFIKDKSFQCNRIYLRNPQRIDALMMIMTLSLFVYNLGQYQLREKLKAEDASVPNQLGKPTQQPTLAWVFVMLRGISSAYMADEYVGVINIGEREAHIINLMGEEVIEIYDMK
jgi:transposase